MADRLPDLVLPCWNVEGASLRLTHQADNTVGVVVFEGIGHEERGIDLSTHSRKLLREWLEDLDG